MTEHVTEQGTEGEKAKVARSTPWRDDRGAASVWAVALLTALATISLAAAVVGELAIARRHAAAVADLAAIAGAQSSSGCAEVQRVVAANDVVLDGCAMNAAGDVHVRVRVTSLPLTRRLAAVLGAGPPIDVIVEARAGPPQ